VATHMIEFVACGHGLITWLGLVLGLELGYSKTHTTSFLDKFTTKYIFCLKIINP
jgi:hypothetical protein